MTELSVGLSKKIRPSWTVMNGMTEEVENLRFSLHADRFPGICTGFDIYFRCHRKKVCK